MKRTLTAALLTLGAVALPCVAWYVAGSRAADREAAALLEEPTRRARDAALRLAERLTVRLEELRRTESERPFYHYQSLYHDPRGASEGRSVVPSPLASGPTDPVVRAHFQIDSHGQLTLPSLNEEVCDLNLPESVAVQQPILQELQAAARGWWHDMRERGAGPPVGAYRSKLASAAELPTPPPAVARKVEVLEASAWTQNVQASQLYVDLKTRKAPPLPEQQGEGAVVIQVGELQWHTVQIGGLPTLAALREVVTPAGPLTQGLQLSRSALQRLVADAPWPASFEPGAPESPTDAAVPVGDQMWHVRMDAGGALGTARLEAAGVRSRFLHTFLLGSFLALVSGSSVVLLVARSERLAIERSRFAASAAHELRTPLAGMRMYGEMLAEGLGDPARAGDYARRIAEEAERLGRVVSNVLGFTRLERGTLKVRCRPGDLRAALEPVLARVTPRLSASGASLRVDLAEVPEVPFDPDAVQQIVENLLDNAEKHTRGAPDRTIGLSLADATGRVELSVSDRGPGVPLSHRGSLFRPFTRVPTADAPAGLGLGLVMVRALAEAMGAEAGYADAPGGGARFWIRFPAALTEPLR